ncbi:MAG: DUF1015 domain-containing protein [Spirochaetaceae bacterium]|jgi:hypothetical protein|nr:DUF1015 domain-containing protein [Spirochaetaceae bacterium]
MDQTTENLAKLGVMIPQVSVPSKNIDIEKWAVVACDQFTQDKDYWKRVDDFAGGAPSTLNIIFPEAYLGDDDKTQRITKIHRAMADYVKDEYSRDNAMLLPPRRAGVFVERQCLHGVRRGLIIAFDLEQYDWRKDSHTLIRPTEETIVERLPPRVEIRMNAPLECPHILVLVDDDQNILMQLLVKLLKKAPLAYDGALMFDGGSVSGRLLYRKNDWDFIADTLNHLLRSAQTQFGSDFLFAVGDGNHSFATAKEVWTRYKAEHAGEEGLEHHPARWVLAEIVNLHDGALVFKPIHRLLLKVKYEAALSALRKLPDFSAQEVGSQDELARLTAEENTPHNRYGVVSRDKLLLVESRGGYAATIDVDPLLSALVKETEGAAIDYIHGDAQLFDFARGQAAQTENVGILLPPFRKDGFFKSVVKNGPLPQKSFSMGEASEKRYYLECRKLFC